MEYTKRELVKREDGTDVYYVEGLDGDGDPFVGYEAVPVEPEPDPLSIARDRLAADGAPLTKEEQLMLLDRLLGR